MDREARTSIHSITLSGDTAMTMYHKHHITPKHAGGSNDPSNIVSLTIEEHSEAHRVLFEIYGRWQDKLAHQALSGIIGKEELIKTLLSNGGKTNKGKKYNKWKNPMSIEQKEKIGRAQTGQLNNFYGKNHSEETKIILRKAARERNIHPMQGKCHSQETKDRISAAKLNIKLPKRSKEHCRKISESLRKKNP